MGYSETLGVASGASSGEIQAAFRKSALELHPDHNNSPEAGEAFARIKEARDELMKRAAAAEAAQPRDDTQITQATTAAVRATVQVAFSQADDPYAGMTAEEIEHVQMLDQLAQQYTKTSLFRRRNETPEMRKHRKKLATNFKRIDGRY